MGSLVAVLVLFVGAMAMANANAHISRHRMGEMPTVASHEHGHFRVLATDVAVDRMRGRLPTLKGKVTDGLAITISQDAVPAGRYRIVVDDQTANHNWHIRGRGVDQSTSVTGTGRTVWRVRLRVDTYSIHCDVHPQTMRTSLTVT
ncbi:MAG: hypothetical protein LH645_09525 [Actinomycetia bacterium]|nr:hypothetical protein [Actinomycetes bacterium]